MKAWHELTTAETLERLNSSEAGLASGEAGRRLSAYGPNVLDLKVRRTPFRILLNQFTDFMILVLMGAAILSGVVGDLKDTVVIAVILLLNGGIGFIQEYRAERALEALQKMAAPVANVVRDGIDRTVSASDVVPGDIVVLEAGAIVPGDARLIKSAQLRTEEAALTGESHPVEKTDSALQYPDLPLGDRTNIAYMGTVVTYGRGRAVVIGTGKDTEFGRIAALLHMAEESQTPLQRRLEQLGRRLAIAALAVAAFVFVMGAIRGEALDVMFLTAVSLAVAAIPEALPAVVTISLALGAHRLVQKQALVRKLAAVEALGSVTVICSDKTGTLTQNRMSVERFYCGGTLEKTPQSDPVWDQLLLAMALSNDVRIHSDDSAVGDPTEVALFNVARDAGVDKYALEENYPRVAELPFDSDRKCMTTVHSGPDGRFFAFTKGATESLLAKANSQVTASGLAEIDSKELIEAAEQIAGFGLRVLAFAVRELPDGPIDISEDALETDLAILGLVGIGDPIRQEAAEAVKICRDAGIVTVMITGDHPVTARAIALDLGVLGRDGVVLTGRELEEMTDDELRARVDTVRVYARVAPEQKLKIVSALQARGNLVAMTGDGVNDAPALKKAEIGIAMGITGSDVAKQASSLILLDDNFATIARAVREGRKIYDNLRRFVRYGVTTNSSEVLTMMIAPLLGLPIPLLPLQILWINLVTDGLPGLALAAEPEESNVMKRPPRSPDESIFADGLGIHVIWVGTMMAALAVGTQYVAIASGSAAWQTMVVAVIGFSQLAHVLAIRSEQQSLFSQGLRSNKPLLGAVAVTVFLQLVVIYLPVMNDLFSTKPLSAAELGLTILTASVVFFAVELEKWLRRSRIS